MRAEGLKRHLDALLLATLAGGSPRHGYAIEEALSDERSSWQEFSAALT